MAWVIEVYDSLTRRMMEFSPIRPGHVTIYTCGVTPYDQSHMGHARPAVIWDVIRRHLRRRGYVVTYVQNFTDVDDKLIRRAQETGRSVDSLAEQFIAEYHLVMNQLGVQAPDFAPRVTNNLDAIVTYIQRLVELGHAYAAQGSVYFRVKNDPEYGKLSRRKLENMLEGESEPGKEYPADFALWKTAVEGEPYWDSPWGPGRPGWHIECSAMSMRYLGKHFDMHGGGMDLLFPHHENERAQSRACIGAEPVSIWVHSGLVTRAGVKMSKSLQNGVSLSELLTRHPAPVIRTYLLSAHYRSPLDFDEERISEWGQGLERIQRLWEDVRQAPPAGAVAVGDWGQSLMGFEDEFLRALDEDFNTARAFAAVFDTVNAAYRGINQGHGETARGLARRNLSLADKILGFLVHRTPDPGGDSIATSLLEQRNQARQARNFALADALRDVLLNLGYEVLDGPEGTRLNRMGGQA